MALKVSINAYEFQALNQLLQSEYKIQSDGSYKLDLGNVYVTDKDPQGLLSALESERNEHKTTKSKFDSIIAERDAAKKAADLAAAQKSGDSEALKKLFEEQVAQAKLEAAKAIEEQKAMMQRQQQLAADSLKKAKAMEIATELFGKKAEILLPSIMQKINVKTTDFGVEPVLEFIGDNGSPILGGTKEIFKQTYLTNPIYSDMIVASHASGGSANGGKTESSGAANSGKAREFKDYSPGELVRLKKTNFAEFQRIMNSKG
jgi:hypothetical protein